MLLKHTIGVCVCGGRGGPWSTASFQFYNAATQSWWPWDFTAGYYGPTHQTGKVISGPNMSGANLTCKEEAGNQKLLNETCQGKGANLFETLKRSVPSCNETIYICSFHSPFTWYPLWPFLRDKLLSTGNVSPSRSILGWRLPLSPPSNAGCSRQCRGSKGMAAIWTWRVVGAKLKDFCQTVSSKHDGEKAPVLIRPLVHKLPIDFHRGWSSAGDQPEFLASTKAKLSHLEAGSAFRDQHSPLTPAANLFPSDGASFFFFGGGGGGGGRQLQNFNHHNGPTADGRGVQFPPSISLQSVWVSNLLLQSGRLQPSGTQPPAFICYFWYKLTGQISQKLHKLIKPELKKQLALHPEPLLCYFISFLAPKTLSEVWVCLNWSV